MKRMSMYQDLVRCGFRLNYGNGKVKKNGNGKLEPDGETSFTRMCKGMDLQACMKQDKHYGLVCVPCYMKLHPVKKK